MIDFAIRERAYFGHNLCMAYFYFLMLKNKYIKEWTIIIKRKIGEKYMYIISLSYFLQKNVVI